MRAFWIVVVVDALFAAMAAALFSGKGGFLIAGYNTASAEEKARYDAKKLGRAVGALLLAVGTAITAMVLVRSMAVYLIASFFIPAAAVAVIVYTNKFCLRGETPDVPAAVSAGQTPLRRRKTGVAVLVAVVLVLPAIVMPVFIWQMSRPPVYSVTGGVLTIRSSYGETVRLADMETVCLQNTLPGGLRKKNGLDAGSVLKGYFTSDSGDATLFVNTTNPPYISIKTKFEWILLNEQSAQKTRALYARLTAAS